ncbi:recombinase family protein [Isosphaeraceae bacterium EP7]
MSVLVARNAPCLRLTIDFLDAVAEDEARRIATRNREALAAYRPDMRVTKRVRALHPNGVPAEVVACMLGASLPQCRNLSQEAREAGVAHRRNAEEAYRDNAGWMAELRAQGLSQAAIAKRLNDEGHTTRRGKAWGQVQVGRVLRRAQDAT